MKNYMKEYSKFGDNLNMALRKRNMTQVALGEALDVDKTHVNKWVKNRVLPSTEYLDRIANVLKYDVEELITGNFKDDILYSKKPFRKFKSDDNDDLQSAELSLVEGYINSIIKAENFNEKVVLKEKLLNLIKGMR